MIVNPIIPKYLDNFYLDRFQPIIKKNITYFKNRRNKMIPAMKESSKNFIKLFRYYGVFSIEDKIRYLYSMYLLLSLDAIDTFAVYPNNIFHIRNKVLFAFKKDIQSLFGNRCSTDMVRTYIYYHDHYGEFVYDPMGFKQQVSPGGIL